MLFLWQSLCREEQRRGQRGLFMKIKVLNYTLFKNLPQSFSLTSNRRKNQSVCMWVYTYKIIRGIIHIIVLYILPHFIAPIISFSNLCWDFLLNYPLISATSNILILENFKTTIKLLHAHRFWTLGYQKY